jgi:hypothetical protein
VVVNDRFGDAFKLFHDCRIKGMRNRPKLNPSLAVAFFTTLTFLQVSVHANSASMEMIFACSENVANLATFKAKQILVEFTRYGSNTQNGLRNATAALQAHGCKAENMTIENEKAIAKAQLVGTDGVSNYYFISLSGEVTVGARAPLP